jgi:hypothetical protein
MNDEKGDSNSKQTQIVEGFPPAPPLRENRSESAEPNVRLDEPTARELFFIWEKLRVGYNMIMLAVLMIKASNWHGGFVDYFGRDFWFSLVVVNIAFCAGPVAENYLFLCGVRRRLARIIIFLAGTMLIAEILGRWR